MGDRIVSGLVVPFGVTAYRGWWDVRFNAGSLSVTDVARVPLMFEHGGTYVVAGVMTDVEERADGVHGTFALDDTPDGDRAAAEFESGSRTGFSIGVSYDDDTLAAIDAAFWEFWETGERPVVDAVARILEVSHVAIPAFDDARGALEQTTTDRAEQPAGVH